MYGKIFLSILFQSTLPRRERRFVNQATGRCSVISIHAPAKGATIQRAEEARRYYISIHAPAKGATLTVTVYHLFVSISIHAPAKGATRAYVDDVKLTHISIHAPAKGATLCIFIPAGQSLFQSTLPRRERPATIATISGWLDFNPRSREGSDRSTLIANFCQTIFQSTLPRRERQYSPQPFS